MASWSSESEYDARLEGPHAPRQVTPDTKPAKRFRACQAEWADIHQGFSGLPCTSCGQGEPLELHHILPRSQGGDDVPNNLVVLCRSCHTRLEGHESGWERVAAAVRQYVITDTRRRRYQEDHAGDFFHRRYPPLHPDAEQISRDFRIINESHAVEGWER
jgi:hypothetical protein